MWLVGHFYKKICRWEFKFLSMGGRITLTHTVITQLGVYWAHLYHLPLTIIKRLNKITANFIWSGTKN